jgi:hypothetical protein
MAVNKQIKTIIHFTDGKKMYGDTIIQLYDETVEDLIQKANDYVFQIQSKGGDISWVELILPIKAKKNRQQL